MRNLGWQWVFVIANLIAGTVGADQTKANTPPVARPIGESKLPQAKPAPEPPAPVVAPVPAPPPPPFKFSISFKQMKDDPRKSQAIVEKELGTEGTGKAGEEIEARHHLGVGFEAIGDFDSAAKNFLRCRALYKNPTENGNVVSVCLLGLAKVARLSSAGMPLAKLYELRKDPLISANLRTQFYSELINNYSFHRDFAKAKQLVVEAASIVGQPSALDQYLLRSSEAFMLMDAKDFGAADTAIKQARIAAGKVGPQLLGWVDHMEGVTYLGKKDFAKAKSSYQKAVNIIGTKGSGFHAFWVHYLGLKVGFYLGDQVLINSAYKECIGTIRGAELESKFLPLLNAWIKLQKRTDISGDLANLNKVLGPNTNLVEELNVARAWQKPL